MLIARFVKRAIGHLFAHRWLALPTVIAPIVAVAYALLATPTYTSEIEIMPVESQSNQLQLSGLAGSLASQFLGSQTGGSNTRRNRELLMSRKMAIDFISFANLMPELFPDVWDTETRSWRERTNILGQLVDEPDEIEGYERLRDMRRFGFDERSGKITLRHSCKEHDFCSQITRDFIRFVNEQIQTRDIAELDQSLAFLSESIASNANPDLVSGIARVYEAQLQQRVHATSRAEYAFFTVDPVVSDDRPSHPRKILIVLLGLFFGVFVSAVLFCTEMVLSRISPVSEKTE